MKMLSIFVGVVVCLTSFAGLVAKNIRTPGVYGSSSSKKTPKTPKVDSRGKKHGDFTMLGTGKDHCVILSNNVMYKPAHDHDEKITRDWQVNDPIRVLQTKDDKRFILLNLRTGKSMKAKILHWS